MRGGDDAVLTVWRFGVSWQLLLRALKGIDGQLTLSPSLVVVVVRIGSLMF